MKHVLSGKYNYCFILFKTMITITYRPPPLKCWTMNKLINISIFNLFWNCLSIEFRSSYIKDSETWGSPERLQQKFVNFIWSYVARLCKSTYDVVESGSQLAVFVYIMPQNFIMFAKFDIISPAYIELIWNMEKI